jgi:peptidoglycan/xylan/chitin deacetylase (PgdA/CDA1 family)
VLLADGAPAWASYNSTTTIVANQEFRHPDNPSIIYNSATFTPTAATGRIEVYNLPLFRMYDALTFAFSVAGFPASGGYISMGVSKDNFSTSSMTWVASNNTQYRPNGLLFMTIGRGMSGTGQNGEHPGQQWAKVGVISQDDVFNSLKIELVGLSGVTVRLLGVFNGRQAHKGSVILGFDDGLISQYDYGYQAAKAVGIPLTIALPNSYINTEGYISKAQADEMYNSGLVDFVGHTRAHFVLTGLTTNDATYQLQDNKNYISKNYPRGAQCMVYPENQYNASVRALARRAGWRYARSINTQYIRASRYGMDDRMSMGGKTLSAATVQNCTRVIDAVIATGQTVWLYGHNILGSNNPAGTGGAPPAIGTDWYKDDWDALVAYVAQKRDAGLLNAMSWSQFERMIDVPGIAVSA